MQQKYGKTLICYGCFLAVMGLLGYLSNPEKAKTALMSGGTFGALSVALGFMSLRGASWTRISGAILTALLSAVFIWRSSASWSAYLNGQPEKLTAAVLITAMGVASLTVLVLSIRAYKSKSALP